jgi:ArsR family transcriptional regulator, arsenate/arsenite/antimonite-responsive transcriptional repressor
VVPQHEGAAQIFRQTLAWLKADKAMQADRARLTRACCAPGKFAALEGAPLPVNVECVTC